MVRVTVTAIYTDRIVFEMRLVAPCFGFGSLLESEFTLAVQFTGT